MGVWRGRVAWAEAEQALPSTWVSNKYIVPEYIGIVCPDYGMYRTYLA